MIGIRLFDELANTVGVLDLGENIDITAEENSPLFTDGGIPSGFTAPGELPNTQHNMAVLGNAHALKRMQYITVYNCEVLLNNTPVYQGKFLLLEGHTNSMQFSIAINGFNTAVLDKKLLDYDWPVDIIYGPDDDTIDIVNYCSDKCKVVDWNEKYTFPVYSNPVLYGEGSSSLNPHFEGIVNEWDDITQKLRYNTTDGAPSSEEDFIFNKYCLVPWFYVQWILRMICQFEGYSINGPALQSAEFKKLVLANNTTLDKVSGLNYYVRAQAVIPNVFPTPVPTLPYTMQIGFNDDITPPNEDLLSCWNSLLGRYTIQKPGYHYVHLYLQFQLSWTNVDMLIRVKRSDGTVVYVQNVVSNVNNPSGMPGGAWYDIDIDFSTYAAASNVGQYYFVEIVFQTIAVVAGTFDIYGFIQIANNSYKQLNVYSNVIDPKNHLPDMTVGDFINMLRDIYNLSIDFDRINKSLQVSFVEDELNATPMEILPGEDAISPADMAIPDKHILRYKEAQEYKFSWDFGGDTLAENFKEVDRATVLGDVATFADIESNYPNANINDIVYVRQLQSYYIRSNNEDFPTVRWFFHSYAYQYYTTGINPADKAPGCSPVITTINKLGGTFRLISTFQEPGTSLAYETGVNTSSVKLAYWHGRMTNGGGYIYPLATSGNYDYPGNNINSNYDGQSFASVVPMEWGYLFNAFWLSWYQFMQAPHEVEIDTIATLSFIRSLKLSQPLTINHITYLAKTIRYRLTSFGPLPTTLILAKKMPVL